MCVCMCRINVDFYSRLTPCEEQEQKVKMRQLKNNKAEVETENRKRKNFPHIFRSLFGLFQILWLERQTHQVRTKRLCRCAASTDATKKHQQRIHTSSYSAVLNFRFINSISPCFVLLLFVSSFLLFFSCFVRVTL